MHIRPLEHKDIGQFLEASKMFFAESRNRDYEIDLERWSLIIQASVGVKNVAVIVAELDGLIAGYAVITYMIDFTREPIGDMYQFYVRPQYRGKGVARGLRDAVVKQFDDWGCPLSYVNADAGIDEDGTATLLFRNLWGKSGYKVTGVTMSRKK